MSCNIYKNIFVFLVDEQQSVDPFIVNEEIEKLEKLNATEEVSLIIQVHES